MRQVERGDNAVALEPEPRAGSFDDAAADGADPE
jgi:hypothetical protein